MPAGQKHYSMTKPIRFELLQGCIDWWGRAERSDREETEFAWKISIDEINSRNFNLDIKNPNKQDDEVGDPQELLEELKNAEVKATELRDELKNSLMEALLR